MNYFFFFIEYWIFCSHGRAYEYFAESIIHSMTTEGFYATKSTTPMALSLAEGFKTSTKNIVLVGEFLDPEWVYGEYPAYYPFMHKTKKTRQKINLNKTVLWGVWRFFAPNILCRKNSHTLKKCSISIIFFYWKNWNFLQGSLNLQFLIFI